MTRRRLEAVLYDWECDLALERQRRDGPFFCDLLRTHAPPGARVTVLGCGTGRVAIPLARGGWHVAGLDVSPERLERARAKASDPGAPQWKLGDMRCFAPVVPQDAVIVPYSAFLLLESDADRRSCMNAIRRALTPRGIAVLDVSPNFVRKAERLRRFMFGAPSPELGGRVEYYETVRQRAGGRTLIGRRYRIRRDDGRELRVAFIERWRTLTHTDLLALARDARLRVAGAFSDYDGAPLFVAGRIAPEPAKHIYVMTPA
jgi:SAM-dependent methyltransferase